MSQQKNRGAFFFLFLALVCFIGCVKEAILVDQYVEIPNGTWAMDNKLTVEFDVLDTSSKNNFFITLRNTEEYKYSNLYVFVTTLFPNDRTSSDTIGVELADALGRWLGKGEGFIFDSEVVTNKILYNYQKKFPLQGHYKITLQQAMRETELNGIIDAGIRIEQIK